MPPELDVHMALTLGRVLWDALNDPENDVSLEDTAIDFSGFMDCPADVIDWLRENRDAQ